MKDGITGEQSSDDNNDNNNTVCTITASILSVLIIGVIIIIIVVVIVCVMRKKQKSRRYVCTSSNKHMLTMLILHSYRISNIHAREMQPKTSSEIYENDENDKSEIEMSGDPNSMHAYKAFKSHSTGQTDAIYETPSADDEEISKAEISNPASTFQPQARENPYVLDTSTENTSNTTT